MSEALNEIEYARASRAHDRAAAKFAPLFEEMRSSGVRDSSIAAAREAIFRSVRLARVDGEDGDDEASAAEYVDSLPYEPFLEAYRPDPKNDPTVALKAQLESDTPPIVRVEYPARDGEFERVDLDATTSRRYFEGTAQQQAEIRARRVREVRLETAVAAAVRLREGGVVTPREELCLRQFGAIVGAAPREARAHNLRENFVGGARAALRSGLLDLEPQRIREWFGWSDDTETVARGHVDGLPLGWSSRSHVYQYGPNEVQASVSDVWDEQAKARHCFATDPICKAAIHVGTDFVGGRGFSVVAVDEKLQAVIDEYDKRHSLKTKKEWMRSALIMGDLFLGHVAIGNGRIRTRKLAAQSIWDVTTLATDPSVPLYYTQRYTTRAQPFAQANNPQQYIDRLWPAADVDHFKINAEENEVRGRPEPYAALPYHLMFRDVWEAQIAKDQAAAAYAFVALVDGGRADVNAVTAAMPKRKPKPGSYFVLGGKVKKFEVLQADKTSPAGAGSSTEGLLNIIAVNYGFAKEYLGVTGARTRGGALTSVGPAEKSFENRQDDFTELFRDCYDRVIAEAQRAGLLDGVEDLTYQIIWPDIVKAEQQTKVQLVVVGRAQGFISLESAAQLWASAVDFGDFDFAGEQQKIADERERGIALPPMPTKFDPDDPNGGKAPAAGAGARGNSGDPAGGNPAAADVAAAIRKGDKEATREAMLRYLEDDGVTIVVHE